jgi:pimeloyl-ACP methyl ester carboxylesterase
MGILGRRIGLSLLLTIVAALVGPGLSPAGGDSGPPAVVTDPVAFRVQNPAVPGETYTVRGTLYRPGRMANCSSSVLLLLHGTAGGAFAWDFPVRPEKYSVTRALAAAGYPTVAIDELGYASSDHPNGYTLTIPSYADISHQIVLQLRQGSYTARAPVGFGRVGLIGHSAGGEMAELSAGTYGGIDLLVVMGFIHFVTDEVARVFSTEEIPRALGHDYVFFWGSKERLHHFHHNPDYIDADVLAKVDELTTLTPSGLVLTIGPFPSRAVIGSIKVPLLLMVSEKDNIFPVDKAHQDLDLFVAAADKTLHVVPNAGHTFHLEPNAPETMATLVSWLAARPAALPPC